jgi:hypothetical protein
MLGFGTMRYSEVHGHLPLMKRKKSGAFTYDESLESVVISQREGEKAASNVHATPANATILESL